MVIIERWPDGYMAALGRFLHMVSYSLRPGPPETCVVPSWSDTPCVKVECSWYLMSNAMLLYYSRHWHQVYQLAKYQCPWCWPGIGADRKEISKACICKSMHLMSRSDTVTSQSKSPDNVLAGQARHCRHLTASVWTCKVSVWPGLVHWGGYSEAIACLCHQ